MLTLNGEKMIDRDITKEELYNLLGIEGSATNAQIFTMCREFQDSLIDQDINITNIGDIYWWIRESRDKLLKAG
jgi:hypothetical protein